MKQKLIKSIKIFWIISIIGTLFWVYLIALPCPKNVSVHELCNQFNPVSIFLAFNIFIDNLFNFFISSYTHSGGISFVPVIFFASDIKFNLSTSKFYYNLLLWITIFSPFWFGLVKNIFRRIKGKKKLIRN